MKKITSKEVFLLVAVAGFLILGVVYVFVYLNYMNLSTQKESSNRALQKEVDELKTYFDMMPEYKKQMAEMKEGIVKLTEGYPADAREEDALMLAVHMQQADAVNFNVINVGENAAIHMIPTETVAAAGLEDYTQQIDFCERKVTYNNQTEYDSLKGLIDTVYQSAAGAGINSVTYVLDENTGTLEGVIDVVFNNIHGMGKEYVKPVIADYVSGTENPFRIKTR